MPDSPNVDDWIDGVQRTRRSVTIYQRADLIADLDDLDRQIQIADAAGDKAEVARLKREWDTVARQFRDSGLKITVQGLHESEFKAIHAQALVDKVDQGITGARLLAVAIVEPKFTVEQLLRLEQMIGEPQIGRIVAAYVKASRTQPPEPVIDGDKPQPDPGD